MLKQLKFVNLLTIIFWYFNTQMCDTTGLRNRELQEAANAILQTNKVLYSFPEENRHILLECLLVQLCYHNYDYHVLEVMLCPPNIDSIYTNPDEYDPLGYENSYGNNYDVICPKTTTHYLKENISRVFKEKVILWRFLGRYINENLINSCIQTINNEEVLNYQLMVNYRKNFIMHAAIRLLFNEYAKEELCVKNNKKCILAGILNLLFVEGIYKQK
ncbi:uncharacterized protein LOC126899894 [Daktulosphaira vitifoliae]|uniref:uncharacterized protein LOC126899894 n=1 Tax=Daktulosphaira vitifoliae TaxID=58002 RepID=UPI0021AA968A|nr:uncharacterized protein LOC126899894 [Daktulosphaira vitifoliae]